MENLVSNPLPSSAKPVRDAEAVRGEIMDLVGEYYDLVHAPAPFDAAP